ncbi:MAG: V-type ATP synthase subunit B, partial [Oscillospiraceae bacterium]
EITEILLDDGTVRNGRVVEVSGERVVLQVFEGTKGLSLTNTRTKMTGHPMEMPLSKEILGRVFNGSGKPIDGLGEIYAEKSMDINGKPLNPVSRTYSRNYIRTGISSIDCLATLIRGQKLPIFSGSGLPHDKLAVQIVRQAEIADKKGQDFAVVFAAMGVKNDVADYFRRSFEESGVLSRVAMFLNLSNDPIIERILTPRCALTAAEYLAYEKNMHILVILTDMTSYAEALREFSSSKGEIPGRKGYPGYLYSDFASLYERAGVVEGSTGSVTQIPILTMPNHDITHPVPDLTGYITEGQIVLDANLDKTGIYPPIAVLPSLSRLMKDGIGEGYTRADHTVVSNQLFASYARVQDARALASVIGEDELSDIDKAYMKFGIMFEKYFICQGFDENRSIDETLDLGWDLLSLLPVSELDRVSDDLLKEKYKPENAEKFK